MSSIAPTVIAAHTPHHVVHIQKRASALPPLSVGEIIQAEVIGEGGGKNVLLSLKGTRVLADCDHQLQKGEQGTFRVEQLHPQVIFRHLGSQPVDSSKIADYLRFYRSNPTALVDCLIEGTRAFSTESLGSMIAHLGRENVDNIQGMIRSLILSQLTVSGSFFRDYVYNLGYLLEKELGRVLEKRLRTAAGVRSAAHNLKGLLLQMSGKLPVLQSPEAQSLLQFVNSSIKTLEAHQIANVMLQESGKEYLFQIPLLFQETTGLAEIYVKYDDTDSKRDGKNKHRTVLFFLTMDALGDVMVNVRVAAKKIGCTITCTDQAVNDFIVLYLEEIKETLSELGYDVGYVVSVVERDPEKMRPLHHGSPAVFDRDRLDVFV